MFVDREHQDYRLGLSPCINAGVALSDEPLYNSDLDGKPRIFSEENSSIDMGAYEYQDTLPNRTPEFIRNRDYYVFKNQDNHIRIFYEEPDMLDSNTFSVIINDPRIQTEIVDETDSCILVDIHPALTNDTALYMRIEVKDNSESQNDSCIDSLYLIVSNKYQGIINTPTVLKDTIEIIGNITVEDYAQIKILPGAFLRFNGCYKIKAFGPISAIGDFDHWINFNCTDTLKITDRYGRTLDMGWGGIDLINIDRDSIVFKYCKFRNTGVRDIPDRSYMSFGTVNLINSANVLFDNCIFTSNFSFTNMGNAGIYAQEVQNLKINRCTFSDGFNNGSSTNFSGTFIHAIGSEIAIDSSVFYNSYQSNAGDNWYSLRFSGTDLNLVNSTFFNNTGRRVINTAGSNVWIENCNFINNLSGVIETFSSTSTYQNNKFINNSRVINSKSGISHIVNNLFAYNHNRCNCSNFFAIGVFIEHDQRTLVANNTFVNNIQDDDGKVIYYEFSSPEIINNVFWRNSNEGIGGYNGVDLGIPDPIIINNIIAAAGTNNHFTLSDTLDYRLKQGSSCINSGSLEIIDGLLPDLDLSGNPRFDTITGIIDVGAYEYNGDSETNTSSTHGIIDGLNSCKNLYIYPIPARNYILINNLRSFKYEIYDITGRKLISGFSDSEVINIEQLRPDLYILIVSNNEVYFNGLFIKD